MVWTLSGQGYHLALNDEQANRLLSCRNELDAVDYAIQVLEGLWADRNTKHIGGGYKDWNALLLCLTDGTYDPRGGTYPLNKCFFGARLLAQGGSIVNLVMPAEVRDVAEVLDNIDRRAFRERYMRLPPNKFFNHRDSWAKDDHYAYELFINLNKLKKFYRTAAAEGRAVIFYTDDPLDYFFEPGGDPPDDEPKREECAAQGSAPLVTNLGLQVGFANLKSPVRRVSVLPKVLPDCVAPPRTRLLA